MAVGRIVRPHGVRGELRVALLTDHPDRLKLHKTLFLGPDNQPYEVEGIRFHKGTALIKLAGLNDRDAVDELRGQLVQIPAADAVPLEEGEFYDFQILGVQVTTDQGEILGQITQVIETGANDVYLVKGERGESLIPAIDQVVLDLDLDSNQMTVRLLPGLLDDE